MSDARTAAAMLGPYVETLNEQIVAMNDLIAGMVCTREALRVRGEVKAEADMVLVIGRANEFGRKLQRGRDEAWGALQEAKKACS